LKDGTHFLTKIFGGGKRISFLGKGQLTNLGAAAYVMHIVKC